MLCAVHCALYCNPLAASVPKGHLQNGGLGAGTALTAACLLAWLQISPVVTEAALEVRLQKMAEDLKITIGTVGIMADCQAKRGFVMADSSCAELPPPFKPVDKTTLDKVTCDAKNSGQGLLLDGFTYICDGAQVNRIGMAHRRTCTRPRSAPLGRHRAE